MTDQLIGRRLGAYTLRELLGSGGMASVYKAYDPALQREVAIKVIDSARKPADFAARFQREARVAARLRHPHIVQIYHFGEQQGLLYMVQELLPGPTLEQQLRKLGRRRMPLEQLQTLLDQLAAALDFAHAQGVVHRDVKPANALYNQHGQLVLTDFGIARGAEDSSRTATGPGVVMGSPAYIAPEQALGSAAVSAASDIYALGAMIFQLLTGRLPFEADTPMSVVLKHLYDDPPSPRSLRPELPESLDAVLRRALSKEPAQRYASAGALAQAVQAAAKTKQGSSRQATAASRARPAARGVAGQSEPGRPKASPQSAVAGKQRPAAQSGHAPRSRLGRKVQRAQVATLGVGAQGSLRQTQVARLGADSKRRAPAPRATTQPARPAPARAAPGASISQPSRRPQLIVGLITLCLLAGLISVGIYLNDEQLWLVLQERLK